MTAWIWQLAELTLAGTILMGIVWILTRLLPQKPRLHAFLWLICALRFILPFAPEVHWMTHSSRIAETVFSSGVYETAYRLAGFGAAKVFAFFWLFGASMAVLPRLLEYGKLKKTLRLTARLVSKEQHAKLDAICTAKRKPLPRRKWLMLLVTGVHWFNPAVWYLNRIFEETCEQVYGMEAVQNQEKTERQIDVEMHSQSLLREADAPAMHKGSGTVPESRRNFTFLSRKPWQREPLGCMLLLSAVTLIGLLIGCDGMPSEASKRDPELDALEQICTAWVDALWTMDEKAIGLLLAEGLPEGEYEHIFGWPFAGKALTLRDYSVEPGEIQVYEGLGRCCTAEIRYWMEDAERVLYPAVEQLTLQETDGGWKVRGAQNRNCFNGLDYEGLETFAAAFGPEFPPKYSEEALNQMETEQTGLFGLSPSETAVKALHLSGGTVIEGETDASEIWYHWESGDLLITMGQAENPAFRVPEAIDLHAPTHITYLTAQSMILNGLPGGWTTEDRLPTKSYFRCALFDPEGAEQCMLAVDSRTGEIYWLDGGNLRPYSEAPMNDVLEQRSTWEGEFYPYQQQEERTILHRIGAHDFSYIRPDGTSGNGRFAGNQGWSDDGKYLFLWCADGCRLEIYGRGENGLLLPDAPESLQSDQFDIRYQERWEQNYGTGSLPVPAEEALENGN